MILRIRTFVGGITKLFSCKAAVTQMHQAMSSNFFHYLGIELKVFVKAIGDGTLSKIPFDF